MRSTEHRATRRVLLAATALASLVATREARAQVAGRVDAPPAEPPPTAPAPVTIVPPKVVKDEGAAYPEQALKDHVRDPVQVVVILDVDVNGAVTRAVVETPAGHGFDEAAVAAAQKLTFEPALRNGKPVAARIKHGYAFTPPPARFVGKVLRAVGEGKPVAGAEVKLHAQDGTELVAVTAADGTFQIADVKAGTYHFTVSAEHYAPQSGDQDFEPGDEIGNVLRLTPEAEAAAVAQPKVKGEDEVEEVRVKGQRPPREVTRRTIEQREMSRIPGTNGDALRSLQNLPGVARPPGFAGLLIVRGSAPQDTNVFVDGTLIPLVYHFGGLSSVVPTEMLEKIDFYPGNFSAQYGRVMGGIVDVGIRDPKKDKLHGLAQVDLIDARVLAEGPLWNSGWNFAVAGRRSYVDLWLKPVLESTGAGVTTAPVYYDYQAMAERDLGKNSSIRFLFFGADDRIDLLIKSASSSEPALGGGISAHTGFYRGQARYKAKWGKDTEFRLTGAFGSDFIEFALGDNYFTLSTYPLTTRAEIAQKITSNVTMNVGMDMLYSPYDVHVRFPPPPRPGQPPPGPFLSRPAIETSDKDALYRPALFTEFEITPWRGGRLVPGVRLDYSKDTKSWDFGPRVVARQDLTKGFPRTTMKGGAGIFYQPPQPQETNLVFGQPGLTSNRAYHYDVGVEQEITHQIEASLEGYYKQLDHLVTQGAGNVGRGRAYGAEVLLRYKPDARFFGWLAYTLSRSERQDTPDTPMRLSPFDQTHILTVLGSYRLGRGWEIGGRFRLVSGSLYTPQTYGFYDENSGVLLPLSDYPRNGARLPLFHQLDIRVDKVWKFKAWQFSAYLDVQNVYNHANAEGVSYNYNSTQRTYASGLPILPSLGVRGEF